MVAIRSSQGFGLYTAGRTHSIMYPTGFTAGGSYRLVIAIHGRGGSVEQFDQSCAGFTTPTNSSNAGAMALARTGRYIVMSIDAGGPAAWSNPTAMTEISSAVTWARANFPLTASTKYGLLGWSMGGMASLNKLKRDAANISAVWTWTPMTDLDWAYMTAGHYTTQYAQAIYATEINAAFGSYAATAGYRIWDEATTTYRALTVPTKIVHATDDTVLPQVLNTNFVTNVASSYITFRQPTTITGNHTGLFYNVPDQEIVDFYDTGNW